MKIDAKTEIYGIIGDPVSHSRSPVMHNSGFRALSLNCVYLAFPVKDVRAALSGLRGLGIKGVSVTIPHKQTVIPLLDQVDPVAAKIGAVNTIINKNGSLKGLNTDWIGANRALEEKTSIKGKNILLLGAGGSARSIGFGLNEAGARPILASRTPAKGQALAAELDCPWKPLTETAEIEADILVNATSVGMAPASDASPVNKDILNRFRVVMDIVYSPLETRLLREAGEAGCRTINGLAMLLYQGAAQFELWTGREAPLDVMRDILSNGK
ncbi:MAG: shikimate dehydrogenase [Desulfobia sp.]